MLAFCAKHTFDVRLFEVPKANSLAGFSVVRKDTVLAQSDPPLVSSLSCGTGHSGVE
ncbi:hypothetical protein EMIT0P100_220061 [Pseudomonas sp. IT-P100]